MKKYALVALVLLGLESRGMTEPIALEEHNKGAGFSRVLTSIGETALKAPVWTARFLGRGVKNIVESPVQSAILFANLCLVTQAVAAGWRQFCLGLRVIIET